MITEEELRALIFTQIDKVNSTTNPASRLHHWVTLGALGPAKVFDLCGIPWKPEGNGIVVSEDWLKEHGFVEFGEQGWRHPRF